MNWLLPFWFRVRLGVGPRLWLPVFVLWPVLWLLLLVFLIVACALGIASGLRGVLRALRATRELYTLLCSVRGTRCEVTAHGRGIEVVVI